MSVSASAIIALLFVQPHLLALSIIQQGSKVRRLKVTRISISALSAGRERRSVAGRDAVPGHCYSPGSAVGLRLQALRIAGVMSAASVHC